MAGVGGDTLRLRVAGRFTVERDGERVDERAVGSRKARTLLKILAAARGRIVSMDRLVETLWGDAPPAKAEANVASLVSRVRAVIGAAAIDGGRAGYRLATGTALTIDVDEAEALVDEAEARAAAGQPALALTAATAALGVLGRGDVFEDAPAAEWAFDLARETARLVRRARAATWQSNLVLGDARAALAVAEDATAADPLDEEAHRAVMIAHHRLDEPGEALRAYSRLRTVLVEELGADPAPETRTLHAALLREEPIDDASLAATAVSGAPGRVGATTAEPGFVGRDVELDALVDLWATASRGKTSCTLISGEAGIGKTRLATELAAQAHAAGAVVVQARCYEPERSLFLQPIIELVRTAVTTLPPELVRRAAGERAGPLAAIVAELDQLLRPRDYTPASGEIERRRIFEAVAAFLGGVARQRPLLAIVDDLHHAGESTVELIHFMLRWDPAVPLLVVATARRHEAADTLDHLRDVTSPVELGPLPDEAVRMLAGAAGVVELAPALARRTRGHTLFVVEALRTIAELAAGDDERSNDESIPLPDSLRTAVEARVRRCGHEVAELLRAAVVVGSSFDVATVAALLGVSPDAAAARAANAADAGILLVRGGGYEFANDLIAEALYAMTPQPTRVVRHRQLAALLADRPAAAAAHAAAAGDLEATIGLWLEAGRRALATFANREAEHLFGRAIDTSEEVDDVRSAHAHLGRGRARVATGRYEEAADDFATAHRLAGVAGSAAIEAAALQEHGWCAYHARDLRLAGALAEQAANHPAAGSRAQILRGRIRNTAGDLPGAIDVLEPLTGADTDPAARAMALSCLGTALAHGCRYGEAIAALDEAEPACRRAGVLRGLLNAEFFGCYARANLGDLGGALACADRLRSDAERFEATATYLPRALNLQAWVWREFGDVSRSRDLAHESLDHCGPDTDSAEGEPAANAFLALAECALIDGDDVAARRWLDAIEPLLSDRVGYRWRIELHTLELLVRIDPSRAEELVAVARQRRSRKYEALGLAHLGRLDDAAATARATNSPLLVARVAAAPIAKQAIETLIGRLPPALRDTFATHGLVTRRFA